MNKYPIAQKCFIFIMLYSLTPVLYASDNQFENTLIFLETGAQSQRVSMLPDLKKGEWNTLFDVEGPGMITHMWFTFPPRDTLLGKRNLLRIYWDNEERPSVEAPLGDFFGVPFGFTGAEFRINSRYIIDAPNNGLNCYFKMPFSKHAKIELFAEQPASSGGFYFQADYYKFSNHLPEDYKNLRFHAQFRFENPCDNYGKNYLFLDAAGKGFLAGVTFGIETNQPELDSWYHGGGDMIYIDGETTPAILHGIGAEDFFGHSWGVKDFQSSSIGTPYFELNDDKTVKRVALYRFFEKDPIFFQTSLRAVLGALGNCYSSVAYWYQSEPHVPFFDVERAHNRNPGDTARYGTYDIEENNSIEWKLLAPFRVDAINPFEKEQPFEINPLGDENFIYTSTGKPTRPDGNMIKVHWISQKAYHNFIDFNTVARPAVYTIFLQTKVFGYAFSAVESNEEKNVVFHVGFDDDIIIRVNGEIVYKGSHTNGFVNESFPVHLRKGKNPVLIKLSNYDNTTWRSWAFSFRMEEK